MAASTRSVRVWAGPRTEGAVSLWGIHHALPALHHLEIVGSVILNYCAAPSAFFRIPVPPWTRLNTPFLQGSSTSG